MEAAIKKLNTSGSQAARVSPRSSKFVLWFIPEIPFFVFTELQDKDQRNNSLIVESGWCLMKQGNAHFACFPVRKGNFAWVKV